MYYLTSFLSTGNVLPWSPKPVQQPGYSNTLRTNVAFNYSQTKYLDYVEVEHSGILSTTRTGITGIESHHSLSRLLPWLFPKFWLTFDVMVKQYTMIPIIKYFVGINAIITANPLRATITISACCNHENESKNVSNKSS